MKKIIAYSVCVLTVLAATFAAGFVKGKYHIGVLQNNDETNNMMYYTDDDIPPADPMMVGKWQNTENEGWYKEYYDDYADDGMYWGKEWNEKDDVFEEDLIYHRNGWFRWAKNGKELKELSAMEINRDLAIAKFYNIVLKDRNSMQITDQNNKKKQFNFIRIED